MSTIEIPEWINQKTVEEAYRTSRRAMAARRESIAATGMRAAKARDGKLLKTLEGGAKVLQKMSEEQFGPHGMDVGGIRVPATEFQLWREAYRAADGGMDTNALTPYMWIYAAAAILCGYAS